MALIDKLTAIGDSFRASRGTTQQYTLDEMAALAAEKTGITPVGIKQITTNGSHDVTEFATAEVDVQDIIDVTELPTENIDTTKYYRIDDKLYKYDDGIADTNNVLGTWTFDSSLLEQKLLQHQDPSDFLKLDCIVESSVGTYFGMLIDCGALMYFQDPEQTAPTEPAAFIDGGKIECMYFMTEPITITSGSDETLAFLQETATKEAGTPHWDCYYIPKLEALTVTPRATDQIITPNYGKDGLSKVTIKGDSNLVPANIKKDVTIFGVKGTNAPNLQEKTVTVNGEATPDEGYDGLSKVTVDVPLITEIATASEMTALLTEENINRLYRFTGTTDETYINGDLYEVVSK